MASQSNKPASTQGEAEACVVGKRDLSYTHLSRLEASFGCDLEVDEVNSELDAVPAVDIFP